MASEQKSCEECHKDFLILDQEKAFYIKKELPFPTQCPKCRQNKRLALRNERNLFKRNCDKCGSSMISPYRPESSYKVYCQKCFWEYVG